MASGVSREAFETGLDVLSDLGDGGLKLVEWVRTERDPRRRIDTLIDPGLNLPHGAEAAIRAWSSADAELFANWGLYLLVQMLDALDAGRFVTVLDDQA